MGREQAHPLLGVPRLWSRRRGRRPDGCAATGRRTRRAGAPGRQGQGRADQPLRLAASVLAVIRPTTAADLPQAREFARQVRECHPMAVTGLRLLTMVGKHQWATDMLRALEDGGHIRCIGPDRRCPRMYRGDLVGQLYGVPRT